MRRAKFFKILLLYLFQMSHCYFDYVNNQVLFLGTCVPILMKYLKLLTILLVLPSQTKPYVLKKKLKCLDIFTCKTIFEISWKGLGQS